jgi:hypothetical protein
MDSEVVQPVPQEVSLVARRSHQVWSGYLESIRNQAGVAESCVRIENIIGPTPAFPHSWLDFIRIDGARHYPDGSSELYLCGQGCWRDMSGSCHLKPKAIESSLLVGIQKARRFKLVRDGRFREWPGGIISHCLFSPGRTSFQPSGLNPVPNTSWILSLLTERWST